MTEPSAASDPVARVCDDPVCRSNKLGHALACPNPAPHDGDCMDQPDGVDGA